MLTGEVTVAAMCPPHLTWQASLCTLRANCPAEIVRPSGTFFSVFMVHYHCCSSAKLDGTKMAPFPTRLSSILVPPSPLFPPPHEQRILTSSRTEYEYLEQGSAIFRREAVLPEGTVPSRASFFQGDACSLDVETLGSFDAVLASNLLCRCVPKGLRHWLCSWVLESMNEPCSRQPCNEH